MKKLNVIFGINVGLFALMLLISVPVLLFSVGLSHMFGIEALKYMVWVWVLLAVINAGLLFYCPKKAQQLSTAQPNGSVVLAFLPSVFSLGLVLFLCLQVLGN